MSIHQKYAWREPLVDCPRCRPKGQRPKRVVKEAQACFEKFSVIPIKDFLKTRIARWNREKKELSAHYKTLLNRLIHERNPKNAKQLHQEVNHCEHHLHYLDDHIAHDERLQKTFT